VRQDGNLAPVKEIKQPILNMALFGAQFINAVSQIIGRGSPEFVPRLGQKLDSSAAIGPCSLVRSQEFAQPVDHRRLAIGLLIKRNVCSGHNLFTAQNITILI
jgi:hypothetical protein